MVIHKNTVKMIQKDFMNLIVILLQHMTLLAALVPGKLMKESWSGVSHI